MNVNPRRVIETKGANNLKVCLIVFKKKLEKFEALKNESRSYDRLYVGSSKEVISIFEVREVLNRCDLLNSLA